jgi:ribosomal protein S1
MKAFQVHLNGKQLCTAGLHERDVVLAATIDYVSHGGNQLALTVSGLISPKAEHVRWVTDRKLRNGDEIRVKIIETDSADNPRERYTRAQMRAPTLKQRKRYIREMAEQFGWTITVKSSRPSKRRK